MIEAQSTIAQQTRVASRTCPPGPCYTAEGPEIPAESAKVASLIPIQSIVQLPVGSSASLDPVPVAVGVHDSTRAQIPEAKIEIQPSKLARTVRSEGQGFGNLTSGDYKIIACSSGFISFRKEIDVAPSESSAVDFSLVVGGGGGVETTPDPHQLVFIVEHNPVGILKPEDFAKLPHKTITFHNVHSKADEVYSGVPLSDLLAKFGAPTGDRLRSKAMSDYIVATGSDGYKAVLSLATDPSFHPGDVLVADTMDGKPIGDKDGPFRLVVSEDKRPARSVHNLVSIELRTAD